MVKFKTPDGKTIIEVSENHAKILREQGKYIELHNVEVITEAEAEARLSVDGKAVDVVMEEKPKRRGRKLDNRS